MSRYSEDELNKLVNRCLPIQVETEQFSVSIGSPPIAQSPPEQEDVFAEQGKIIEKECVSYLRKIVTNSGARVQEKISACKLLLDRTSPVVRPISIQSAIPTQVILMSPLRQAQKVLDAEYSVEK